MLHALNLEVVAEEIRLQAPALQVEKQGPCRPVGGGGLKEALKHVTHYEFVTVLSNVTIKVIVKQTKRGGKNLDSISLLWRLNRNRRNRRPFDGQLRARLSTKDDHRSVWS